MTDVIEPLAIIRVLVSTAILKSMTKQHTYMYMYIVCVLCTVCNYNHIIYVGEYTK